MAEVVYTTKPNMAGDFRTLPPAAFAKLSSAFEPKARPETKAETSPAPKAALPSPEETTPVLRVVPSLSPALWSPVHRRWTCQPATVIRKPQPQPAPEILEVPEAEATQLVEPDNDKPKPIQAAQAVLRLCSTAPALWSPLHRKWCGDVLKMQIAHVPTLLVKKAASKALLLQEGCPDRVASIKDVAMPEAVEATKDVEKAEAAIVPVTLEAPKTPMPPRPLISCSAAPAIYSKWHNRWTGFLPQPATWSKFSNTFHAYRPIRTMTAVVVVISCHW